jgi:hypothetical protein
MNFLPGLASNLSPPDLCFTNSWDYSHVPPCLDGYIFFNTSRNLKVHPWALPWILEKDAKKTVAEKY